MSKELPKKPSECPIEYAGEERFLRNALISPNHYMQLTFEPDDDDCDCSDDAGMWHVEVSGRRTFSASSESIIHALWFVLEHVRAEDRSAYEQWEETRRSALAKLSHAERAALGLRVTP